MSTQAELGFEPIRPNPGTQALHSSLAKRRCDTLVLITTTTTKIFLFQCFLMKIPRFSNDSAEISENVILPL